MDANRVLLGLFVPGDTWWHRLQVGWKYVVFLVITVPAVVTGNPLVALGCLAASLIAVATTRSPWRLAFTIPLGFIILLAILAVFQVVMKRPDVAVTVTATLLAALYSSRLLLLTTPVPELIDVLVAVAKPFRFLGADPERFGLAVAIMLRSIPYVAGCFGDVQRAARARGLERNPLALLTPVVIMSVAYAKTTGEALVARGLGEASR